MIKGEHCAMCNANIICEEIKPKDDYCEEVKAKYDGKAAAKETDSLFVEVKNRLKDIEQHYGIPYFILLISFNNLIAAEFELLGD